MAVVGLDLTVGAVGLAFPGAAKIDNIRFCNVFNQTILGSCKSNCMACSGSA